MASNGTPHAYTLKLREEIDRNRQSVRGRNGVAEQARLAPSRVEEIVAGDRPTEEEHRALCRGLPRMKFYLPILQGWLRSAPPPRPPPPDPRASAPASAMPARPAAPPLPPTPPAPLVLHPRTFGEYVRAAREREGWSPEDLAVLIECSPAAVRFWEDGTSNPVAENYERLLLALPALAGPDVPRPDVRDIPKPVGRSAPEEAEPPVSAPSAPSAPVDPGSRGALIAFGRSLGKTLALLGGKGTRAALVALLRDGAAAGLSAEEIAASVEADG